MWLVEVTPAVLWLVEVTPAVLWLVELTCVKDWQRFKALRAGSSTPGGARRRLLSFATLKSAPSSSSPHPAFSRTVLSSSSSQAPSSCRLHLCGWWTYWSPAAGWFPPRPLAWRSWAGSWSHRVVWGGGCCWCCRWCWGWWPAVHLHLHLRCWPRLRPRWPWQRAHGCQRCELHPEAPAATFAVWSLAASALCRAWTACERRSAFCKKKENKPESWVKNTRNNNPPTPPSTLVARH